MLLGTAWVVGCAEQNEPISVEGGANLQLAGLVPEESNPSTLSASLDSEDYPPTYSSTEYQPLPSDIPAGSGQVHVMQPGQTLYRLAVKYYGDGKQWPRIRDANTERISDPRTIPVGTKLIIP
jgi:nucleoid-associated protein YgaU